MSAIVAQRTCQADGSWDGQFVQCAPIDCGVLGNPPNGGVRASSTTFNSEATYTCNEGYTMGNVSPYRICQADGTWSGATVNCTVSTEPTGGGETEVNIAAIAGGVAAGAVVFALIAFLVGRYIGQRNRRRPTQFPMMDMRAPPIAPQRPKALHSGNQYQAPAPRGGRSKPKRKKEAPVSRDPHARRVPPPGPVAGRYAGDTLPSKPSTGKQSSKAGSSGSYDNLYHEIESTGTSYLHLERDSVR